MKNAKKLLALVMALIMVCTMSVSVFADDPMTGSIVINNAVNGTEYTIYQLFGAQLDTTNEESDGTYPISYFVDEEIDGEPNPVYALLTSDETLKEDFILTPSASVEGRYVVSYKDSTTTELSANDVTAFMKLYDEDLTHLKQYKLKAEDDVLTFDPVDFGYYMVKSQSSDGTAAVAINSTNPKANISLKEPRKPSNPDKVEDRTEVFDGSNITYNTSVKAVNYTIVSGKSTQVMSYAMTDTPDFEGTVGVSGNDAAWPKINYLRVYDANALAKAGKLNEDGSIKTKADGLYDLDGVTAYVTVPAYAGTPISHYKKGADDKYAVTWDDITDTGYYNAVKSDGSVDYYTIRIPWAKQPDADGKRESLYYPVSYIIAEYEQFIDKDLIEIFDTQFDGTYVNRVDYKYDTNNSSGIEIGNDSVAAFVTGISLRKHAAGETDDEKVLDGAKYIAYKTVVTTSAGASVTEYYSYHEYTEDEYADLETAREEAFVNKYKEEHDGAEPDAATILAYNMEHPICHTAWLKEEGEVDPKKYTTFTNATILEADNSYSTVEIKNLYDDTFYLQEVEAPFGYNCPNVPYLVTVTPTEDMSSSQAHFEVTISNQNKSELPAAKIEGNDNNFYTAQLYDGEAPTMPTTGGAGTVALIAIGSILFIATALVLVTKKRMYNAG